MKNGVTDILIGTSHIAEIRHQHKIGKCQSIVVQFLSATKLKAKVTS